MPRRSTSALIIVDMINLLDFPQGPVLARRALAPARRIAALKRRFAARGAPVVYANDNFGQWHMDFRSLVDLCATGPGAALAALCHPEPDDYYVLKPRHSAFFATPLHVLLRQLRVDRVVICGIATDLCVAASAIEARMHGYEVAVPRDCCQAQSQGRHAAAVRQLEVAFGVATTGASSVRL